MGIDDIEFLLLSKWNGTIDKKEASQELKNKIGNYTIQEFYGKVKKKQENQKIKPYSLLVTTAAFLCSGQCTEEDIYDLISKKEYVSIKRLLISGLGGILTGKIRDFNLSVKRTDLDFPNKYAYVKRHYRELQLDNFREIIKIARVLYSIEPERLQEVIKKDINNILLFNYENLIYSNDENHKNINNTRDRDFIKSFLSTEHNELKQAFAFTWLSGFVGNRIKENDAERILNELKGVDNAVILKCLYEFILEEHTCPKAFSDYMLKPSLRKAFETEFQRTELINSWNEVNTVCCLINNIKNTRRKGSYFRKLSKFIIQKIKDGRLNGFLEKSVCFLKSLKLDELVLLKKELESIKKELHAEKIDCLVRYNIYLKDIKIQYTIEQLMEEIKNCEQKFFVNQ